MVATQRSSEASLRRAAILLSNLDAENRRRLLAHLAPHEASKLRAAAAALSDVDPLEIRRTVSAFVGGVSAAQQQIRVDASMRSRPTAGDGRAPSTDASGELPGSPTAGSSEPTTAAADARAGGLRFLNDVSDATLLRAVGSEHPQTIAVVLASIDPRQAARLLRQLSAAQRSEAVRRLSRLEEVPQEAIDDIGRHLRGLVGTLDPVGNGEGRRLLTSIFSALDPADRDALGASLDDSDGGIVAALEEASKTAPRAAASLPAGTQPSGQPTSADYRRNAHSTPEQSSAEDPAPHILPLHRSQLAAAGPQRPEQLAPTAGSGVDREGQETGNREQENAWLEAPLLAAELPPGIESADGVLEHIPPVQLRETLAKLTAREALLALCGLSPRCVRRLLRTMPRRVAKDVRQRLDALGPLDLREVDRAKQRAAAVALGRDVPQTASPALQAA